MISFSHKIWNLVVGREGIKNSCKEGFGEKLPVPRRGTHLVPQEALISALLQ